MLKAPFISARAQCLPQWLPTFAQVGWLLGPAVSEEHGVKAGCTDSLPASSPAPDAGWTLQPGPSRLQDAGCPLPCSIVRAWGAEEHPLWKAVSPEDVLICYWIPYRVYVLLVQGCRPAGFLSVSYQVQVRPAREAVRRNAGGVTQSRPCHSLPLPPPQQHGSHKRQRQRHSRSSETPTSTSPTALCPWAMTSVCQPRLGLVGMFARIRWGRIFQNLALHLAHKQCAINDSYSF